MNARASVAFVAVRAACEASSELACNDGAPDLGSQSRVTLNLSAWQTILIVVDGYNDSGDYQLSITTTPPTPTPTPTLPPDFSCVQQVLEGTPPLSVQGDTSLDTNQMNGASCGANGDASAPDFTYTWTAASEGLYMISVDGSFARVLSVRSACNGTELACVNPASGSTGTVVLALAAGEQIVIIVDGNASQGAYTLAIAMAPPTPMPIPTAPPLPTPASSLELSVVPSSGAAPLQVTFTYDFHSVHAIQTIALDYDGDGIDDFTITDANATLQNTYSAPGTYTARLTITDDQGTALSATAGIEVLDGVATDAMFTAAWDGMNAALIAGYKEGALGYLTDSAKGTYGPVFDVLLPYMPEIVASYSPLQRVSLSASVGEYAISRTIDGRNRVFLIYFIKEFDGVWRLASM